MSASLGHEFARFLKVYDKATPEERTRLMGQLTEPTITRKRGGRNKRFNPPIINGVLGRIHQLTITVDESLDYLAALEAAGPNTGTDWTVRKIGGNYPPDPTAKPRKRRVVLVYFAGQAGKDEALAWAKSESERTGRVLTPITPRGAFALPGEFPSLNQKLRMRWMWVVSLHDCDFGGERHFPDGWWNGSGRGADAFWPGHLRRAACWVGFLCD